VVAHELDPIESVSNVAFAVNGPDLDVTFDLEADGVAATNYDAVQRGYRNAGDFKFDICNAADFSSPCDPASMTLTNNGGGNYTITVLGGAAEAATDNRYVFRVAATEDPDTTRATRVYFYGDFPASPFEPLAVSAEACNACHGPERMSGIHGGYYAAADGAEPCLVCHGSQQEVIEDNVPVIEDIPPLVAVVHGYHSSWANWKVPPEAIEPHVTYPTYMNNCSVCHATEEQLTAVNAMPFSGPGCFSCHEEIPFPDDTTANLHANVTVDTNCQQCHAAGSIAPDYVVVTDAHNGAETGNDGIIFDGVDTSVTEGEKIVWEITNIADDGTDLTITWQASYDSGAGPVGVNPCNDTVGEGTPVFHAGDGSVRIYRSYAQGDDFIIGLDTSEPGQPARDDVTTENTTCDGNIATTTIPVDDDPAMADAEKGRLVFGGKPLVVSVVDPAESMVARVPSPTFDWLVGTGGATDPGRRGIVDTGLCLQCHVGSLYQHGGDRVDNVDICLMCHNSASNEQSVRNEMGVDASEAYDGKAGETFELKTMLHRIHSAGQVGSPPYVIYRGRGIYAFAPDRSGLPNWPGEGEQVVYGSDFSDIDTPGDFVVNHNFHAPTYPRSINDCAACHAGALASVIPDQTQAMATTLDAGNEACEPGTECDWSDLNDDTLQGPATTACVTCHKDGAAKGHAYQNGWTPQVFPEGRQTIIDSVR
jgi:OmcA/MtrC family decaheme c-type cytochrome